MSFTTTYNGLQIDYTVDDYVPAVPYLPNGDPGYPSEGGECDDWEVSGVEDMDQLVDAIEDQLFAKDPAGDWVTRKAFRILQWCVHEDRWEHFPARQQQSLIRHFGRFAEKYWANEIADHCTEHYWHEVGGPSGEEDYCFDG